MVVQRASLCNLHACKRLYLWGSCGWFMVPKRNAARDACEDDMKNNETLAHKHSCQHNLSNSTSTYYGSRPNFKGVASKILFKIYKLKKKNYIIFRN